MKVSEIAMIIESFAPINLAEDYDNVGLIVGNSDAEVNGIVACVDVTKSVIKHAIESGANLIIAHHPIIFHATKSITAGDYVSEIVTSAIINKINIYAAHTNMDNAPNGNNYRLAQEIGGHDVVPFLDGGGVVFNIKSQLISSFRDDIAKVLNDENARLYIANQNELVTKCALICGAGGRNSEIVNQLFPLKTQVFITSELANNVRVELVSRGISIVEVSHHESERVFCDIIDELLAEYGQKVLKYKRI